jgi:hypothetical protein
VETGELREHGRVRHDHRVPRGSPADDGSGAGSEPGLVSRRDAKRSRPGVRRERGGHPPCLPLGGRRKAATDIAALSWSRTAPGWPRRAWATRPGDGRDPARACRAASPSGSPPPPGGDWSQPSPRWAGLAYVACSGQLFLARCDAATGPRRR